MVISRVDDAADRLTVYVCDAIMGSGKTSAAINMMNLAQADHHFVFVTQFLSEVDRICNACGFVQPKHNNVDGKLGNIYDLFVEQYNVASTHALFYRYTQDIIDAIRDGHYTLVLDEVVDVVKLLDISASDVAVVFDANLIMVDPVTKRVEWVADSYDGVFNSLRSEIETSCVTFEDGHFMVWTMPIELFKAFDKVIVLTYMFKVQYQYYYFIHNNVDIKYIDVQYDNTTRGYVFTNDVIDEPCRHYITGLKNKIHIVDNERLNAIGDSYFSLSSTWQKKMTAKDSEELKNNIYNIMRNIWNTKADDMLWTVYKNSYGKVRRNGISSSFLTYNARAVNDYGDRHYLAYCVNVFPHPNDVSYFRNRQYDIDADGLALSEMVQWIWRSAIRNGEDIWIYVPSKRMRWLLNQWINEVSK